MKDTYVCLRFGDEPQVDWGSLMEGKSSNETQRQWRQLVKNVPGWANKIFEQRLDELAGIYL